MGALRIGLAQVSDVPLSNRDIGATIVAPGQVARIEFIADPAASGGDVFQAVASLDGITVSLVLPDGTEVNAASASSLGYSFTASPDTSALGGYIPSPLALPGSQTWIVIPPGAPAGNYQLKLDGRQTAAAATVTASYYSSSNVRAGVFTASPVYRTGQHMVLSGLIFDGLQPIAGANAVVRIVDANNLLTTPEEVALTDSGPFDAASGDGIYSGVYMPSKAGDFTAVFRVNGISPAGVPFRRTVTVGIKVQAPTAQITSWKDTVLDSDGDGLIDAVLIQVSINATVAGSYQAGVALVSDAGVRIFSSLTPTLKAGDNAVTFQFNADALGKLAQDGPYSIRDLVFVYTGSPDSPLADSRPDAGRTAAYVISRRINGLQATPTQLDFGAVAPGTSKDLTVIVQNTGDTPLLMGALPVAGTGFIVVTSLPVSIDARGQAAITVRFTPAGAGAASGKLTVAGLTIPLTGSGGATASAPILSVNPNPFDFQNVTLNQSKSQTFMIGNTGTADLHVSGVQVGGDPSLTLAAPFSAATVKPGGAPASVVVTFKPTQPSMVTGFLVIASDDPAKQPNLSVPLKGAGINSNNGTISVTLPTMDFGTVNLNSSYDITVTIANIGSGVLSVTPSFSPQNPQFTLSPVGPLSINAGTSQPLKLRFSPTAAGAQKATLTLVNSDLTNPALTYEFTGTGAPAGGLVEIRTGDPAIAVTALDFGTVAAGQTKDITVQIVNLGPVGGDFHATYSNPKFSQVGSTTVSAGPNGGYNFLTIRFAPSDTSAQTGTVTFSGVGLSVTVNLKGNSSGGGTPALQFSSSAIDSSGTLTFIQAGVAQVTVRNPGTASVTVVSIQSSSPAFTANPQSLTLAPGGTAGVSVTFAPAAGSMGTQLGTLTFNLAGGGTAALAVKGTAASACLAPASGLVSWWPGDGNANDLTGGNNASALGGVTYGTGKVAQAFLLNGSNGYVSAGNPANLRLSSAISINAWINPSAAPAAGSLTAIVTKWAQTASTTAADADAFGFWLQQNGG